MRNLKAPSFSLQPFPSPTRGSTRLTSARRPCDRCSNTATSAPKGGDCGPHHEASDMTAQTAMTRTQVSPSNVPPMMNSSAAWPFAKDCPRIVQVAQMPDKRNYPLQPLPVLPVLPVANYSSALARAVEWLGDRYLLAQPAASFRRRLSPSMPQSNALRSPGVHAGSHTAARAAHRPAAP